MLIASAIEYRVDLVEGICKDAGRSMKDGQLYF